MDALEEVWREFLYWGRVYTVACRITAGIFVGTLLLILSACSTGQSTGAPQCGTVHEFSPAWQAKLEQEIAWVPESDPIYQAVMDDKDMRDEARACWKATIN